MDAPPPGRGTPVAHVYGDPKSLVPASDEQFALIRGFYTHDKTPLDVRIEDEDTRSPHWVKQRVSYAASYGGERIIAYLFLPKQAAPPYQTVVLFPSSYARVITTSQALDVASFDFIVRSGRALLYPVYYGTYERQRREAPGLAAARDRNLAWARDFFQSVDFVESRTDLDRDRIAYYSLSLGAFFSGRFLSRSNRGSRQRCSPPGGYASRRFRNCRRPTSCPA